MARVRRQSRQSVSDGRPWHGARAVRGTWQAAVSGTLTGFDWLTGRCSKGSKGRSGVVCGHLVAQFVAHQLVHSRAAKRGRQAACGQPGWQHTRGRTRGTGRTASSFRLLCASSRFPSSITSHPSAPTPRPPNTSRARRSPTLTHSPRTSPRYQAGRLWRRRWARSRRRPWACAPGPGVATCPTIWVGCCMHASREGPQAVQWAMMPYVV